MTDPIDSSCRKLRCPSKASLGRSLFGSCLCSLLTMRRRSLLRYLRARGEILLVQLISHQSADEAERDRRRRDKSAPVRRPLKYSMDKPCGWSDYSRCQSLETRQDSIVISFDKAKRCLVGYAGSRIRVVSYSLHDIAIEYFEGEATC